MSGPLSGRGYAPPYDQPRQPILPAIIVAAQPAIVVVATQGLAFGDDYLGSPAVVADGKPADEYDPVTCHIPARVGRRLRDQDLGSNTSLFDRLGRDFTIVHDEGTDVSALEAALLARGIPVTLLPRTSMEMSWLEHKVVFVRPDQHIAWQGNAVENPTRIAAVASGDSGTAYAGPKAVSCAEPR